MALIPKIKVSQDSSCENIRVCDITGLYSSVNTGGYNNDGSDPNILPSAVTKIEFEITPGNGGTAVLKELALDLTKLGECVCVTITPTDFGYTSWDDGAYSYRYIVSDSSTSYEVTGGFTLFCRLEGDVDSHILGMCDGSGGSGGCGPCSEDNILEKITKIKVILDGAQYAAENGAVDCADDLIAKAKSISDNLCNDC